MKGDENAKIWVVWGLGVTQGHRQHNHSIECTEGRRSHRIIGGHKRRLEVCGTEVPQRGPGAFSSYS